jgi:multiple antibiotic resistance protein
VLGSIPILITLKNKMGEIKALYATLVSGSINPCFFLCSAKAFLSILGLDISSFAIAGSIVLFILGLEMVLGLEFFKGDTNAKAGSIVPVAFPIIAGSGTLDNSNVDKIYLPRIQYFNCHNIKFNYHFYSA